MLYAKKPPDIPKLLAVLEEYRIKYVLIGSVAASCYGMEVEPGDLDVTPALDQGNLRRLASVLTTTEARPDGEVGRWETQPDGEKRWVQNPLTPAEVKVLQTTWALEPNDLRSVDHLFVTRYGNLDIVPELAGSHQALMERAVPMSAYGHSVWVAHVDDLLAGLTLPRRKKDAARVRRLRAVQRERAL